MRSGGEAETSVAMETPASKCQHGTSTSTIAIQVPMSYYLTKSIYLFILRSHLLPFRGSVVDGVFWFPPLVFTFLLLTYLLPIGRRSISLRYCITIPPLHGTKGLQH